MATKHVAVRCTFSLPALGASLSIGYVGISLAAVRAILFHIKTETLTCLSLDLFAFEVTTTLFHIR